MILFLLGITLSGNFLSNFALEGVRKQLGDPPEHARWTVEALSAPTSVSVADTGYEIELELPRGITNAGATFGWIRIKSAGTTRKVPINLRVRLLKPVVVTSRRIRKHKSLTHENLRISFREQNGMDDPQSIVGMRVSRTLPEGQVLTMEMIEPLPFVERGHEVKVVFEEETMTISTLGISQEDGWLHDLVLIRIGDRDVSSRVTDRGIVKGVL